MQRLSLGKNGTMLFKNLLTRDGCSHIADMTERCCLLTAAAARTDAAPVTATATDAATTAAATALKEAFLIQAHKQELSAVKWYPINTSTEPVGLEGREGHVSCVWNDHDGDGSNRRVILTGGFTDDQNIYMLVPGPVVRRDQQQLGHDQINQPLYTRSEWRWMPFGPTRPPSFVYGASLTAIQGSKITLDNNGNRIREYKAIRFGGFRSGGYSRETNEVVMLTLQEPETLPLTPEMAENFDNPLSYPRFIWETIPTKNLNSVPCPSRAYHSATLLLNRYLVVFGGMQSNRSIQDLSVLDTETWTWISPGSIDIEDVGQTPSARHGHSAIVDTKRNRLVMFGGGSGSDLLRSGMDNSEVWELKFGDDWKTNFEHSLQHWKWRKIHETVKDDVDNNNNNNSGEGESDQMEQKKSVVENNAVRGGLTPLEALCLGRCHNSTKVTPDKVILMFGSGRPSTNGLVTYDLQMDEFVKPGPTISGTLPTPRFTGVAMYLEEEGLIMTHGGFCTQNSLAHNKVDVLDIAPGRRRGGFDRMPIDTRRRCFGPVTEEDLENGRRDPNAIFHTMLEQIMETDQDQRQDVARQLLGQVDPNSMGGRGWLVLQMIANGVAVMRNDHGDDSDDEEMVDRDEEDDDDDDEDYIDDDYIVG